MYRTLQQSGAEFEDARRVSYIASSRGIAAVVHPVDMAS
jgi:hypothetical protein